MEDSDHLPVRERLKNMANSSGAAGRLVKCRRDMEDAGKKKSTKNVKSRLGLGHDKLILIYNYLVLSPPSLLFLLPH